MSRASGEFNKNMRNLYINLKAFFFFFLINRKSIKMMNGSDKEVMRSDVSACKENHSYEIDNVNIYLSGLTKKKWGQSH